MSHIALIGTGLMGSGMVERFRSQGVDVVVWNRTEEKARRLESFGARVASTPEEAAEGARRVHLVLSNDEAVDAVLERIAGAAPSGTVIVDHTTASPVGTRARAERLAKAGRAFIHAPVFMSPEACRAGVGLMLAAGPTDVVERLRPDLSQMTGEVWHVGTAPDRAAAFKLFGNAMIFAMCAGLSDIFAMGKALGISSPELQELFTHFNVDRVLGYRGKAMANRDFSALFELSMARKDLGLMLDAAAPQGEQLLVLPIIMERFQKLIAAGHGSEDLGVIAHDTSTGPRAD